VVNLLVTWPNATYRRPPELSRPERLAAYELGAALRLDPEMRPEEYQERVSEMRLDRDSRAAFLAATRRRVEAPLPVWLDLLPYSPTRWSPPTRRAGGGCASWCPRSPHRPP